MIQNMTMKWKYTNIYILRINYIMDKYKKNKIQLKSERKNLI